MTDMLLPAGVPPAIALLLIVVSFLTSAFTAAFGIGGGAVMLGALAGTVSPDRGSGSGAAVLASSKLRMIALICTALRAACR